VDELDRLRELLPEQPPPAERTQAKARARLLKLAGESGGTSRRPARRSAIRLSTAAVAVAAVLALLVGPVYLAALLSRPDDSRAISPATGTPSSPVSASSVLLDAARRLDGLDPAPVGAYWKVSALHAVPYEVGTTTKYTVEERDLQEQWIPADPDGQPWTGACGLGARPKTAADERAWASDGEPSTWKYRERILVRKPGTCTIGKADYLGFSLGDDRRLDYRQVAGLPTDAEALRAYLWRLRPNDQVEPVRWLFSTTTTLLSDLPTTPKTRAAALRLLATLPGLTYVGSVTDSIGRTGVGVALVEEAAEMTSTQTLVIDSSNGELLTRTSASVSGTGELVKRGSRVFLSAEWTSAKPGPPDPKLR
jgi:hypothetical protein